MKIRFKIKNLFAASAPLTVKMNRAEPCILRGLLYLSGLYDAKLKNKDENAPFSWTLRDSKKEIQISEVVSFIPYACDIWGHKKCISPEFIFKFSVEKGDTLRWQRRFDLNS